jgi:hypothetical protein
MPVSYNECYLFWTQALFLRHLPPKFSLRFGDSQLGYDFTIKNAWHPIHLEQLRNEQKTPYTADYII